MDKLSWLFSAAWSSVTSKDVPFTQHALEPKAVHLVPCEYQLVVTFQYQLCVENLPFRSKGVMRRSLV